MGKRRGIFSKLIYSNFKRKTFCKSRENDVIPWNTLQKKFFAFYYNKEIILKLGQDFDLKKYGIKKWKYFNPFKNKAPMKNWYQIPYSENKKWEKLTILALEAIKEELKKK